MVLQSEKGVNIINYMPNICSWCRAKARVLLEPDAVAWYES